MPEKLKEVRNDPEQRDYAISLQEMEDGLSVFGRITGTTDDLKQVDKELPFNFRQPFNVVKAIFHLQPGLYILHTGMDNDVQIGFRIDQPTSQLPQSDKVAQQPETNSHSTDSSSDYYRNRALRLEGELHDADRKIRGQVDEIMTLKRELAEDQTATLLTHQKELSDLKETHRNNVDSLKGSHRQDLKELEKQIDDLEKLKFRMEMEQRAGGRDAGSRMLDMLEENAPMFFTVISQLFTSPEATGPMAGPGLAAPKPVDLTQQQAKELANTLKQQLHANAAPKPHQTNAHLNDEAEHPKGAGEETLRHLPADEEPSNPGFPEDENEPPLHALFTPEQRNGHGNPSISI